MGIEILLGIGLLVGLLLLGGLIVSIILFALIAYAFLPSIFKEFLKITQLYYDMKLKKAIVMHFIHFLIFLIPSVFIVMIVYQSEASWIYLLSLVIFLSSSFVGLYIFLFFAYSAYSKNWKKVFIALILGLGVFVFFAPSAFFTLKPVVNYFIKEKNQKDEIPSLVDVFLTDDMFEDKNNIKEQINSESYNYYLNMPLSTEVSNVILTNYYEDFLVASASYNFEYEATPKFFEFLKTHDKYPKEDPKNTPIHRVSCQGFHIENNETQCYFGVLYPYFHNMTYQPKSRVVKHAVGYYSW